MLDMEYIKLPYTNSTNTYAKDNAHYFNNEITVVQAKIQIKGRGRLNRTFISDNNKGAWFSIVIKPKKGTISAKTSLLMPIMAAAATASAIESEYCIKPGIKWPNDILLNNKKVCGILCESRISLSDISFLVIGIGVNVNQKEMHPEISDIATSLFIETGTEIVIDMLVQNICGNVASLYDKIKYGETACIIDKWNEYSLMNNAVITYVKEQSSYNAISKGIDMDGRLIIEQNGKILYLDSSEVSLKIQGANNDR
ncbi:MAG: Bifunctional ligase/repressor BirA [Firmicutes bacterium ADurb.Bin146]|nr:MAG: Bifunctional ligase/repressor BirA [Firmicutes bacterium ADurb.Bin146]